jgi:lipoprotein-releasing system ATP-binding protein
VLQVRNLTKRYPSPGGLLTVLSDVTFSLLPGEAAAITGPSGSGKSTLLYILGALEPPSAGEVTLWGQNPFALGAGDQAAFRNRRIGFVFQDHSLLPQCTVLENVLVPTLVGESPGPNPQNPNPRAHIPEPGFRPAEGGPVIQEASGDPAASGEPTRAGHYVRRAEVLLDQVGLSGRLKHRPGELSGGERQRVAIARALIRQPDLVLCDEPTGNLDQRSASSVASLLLDLHRSLQNILVVVTHSEPLASRFPIRFEIADGRVRRQQAAGC